MLKHKLLVIVDEGRATGLQLSEVVRETRRTWVIRTLEAHHGNSSLAARELGWHRNTFSRNCAELGINPTEFRPQRKPFVSVIPDTNEGRRQA